MPAQTAQVTTLTQARAEFFRHATARILAVQLLSFGTLRVAIGGWSWADVSVAVVLVGLQPFTEWLIHVFVLHCPANGRLRDRLAGSSHRRHHEDPRDLRFQFLHPYALYALTAVLVLLVLALQTPSTVTGALVAVALTATYEWVHFLIHTDYPPRRGPYRRLHRAHRLHHFRNERYWLGVTARTGDRLLGTNPRKDNVEVSPTARSALVRR